MFNFRNVVTALMLLLPISSLAVTATVDDVKLIARLYSAAFDRNPKVDGLNFWVETFESGKPIVEIARKFYESPEFTKKYGPLTNVGYVEQLYRNVLLREGNQTGVDFWEGHLVDGVSRAKVLAEFADSPENVVKTAERFEDMRLRNGLWVFGSDGDNTDDLNPYEGYTSEQYAGPENWLCRPDLEAETNVCSRDISATIVFADGTQQLEHNIAGDEQPVDCFYVYPTSSADSSDNSDLTPGKEETEEVFSHVARYRKVCEVFAPVYRQITVSALLAGKYFDSDLNDIAYGDVLDSFKHFIANHEGRGFILVSHSQGSTQLVRLIKEEIESTPYLAKRMISAHLIGWTVELPLDGEVGATFISTPPCTFESEINCFISYTSFREGVPPIEEAHLGFHFGVTANEDTRAACTHPVDLGGGKLNLDSYFTLAELGPYSDPARNESITTPFVKVPGLVQGECIEQDGAGFLSITQDADPSDPRVDDINNDLFPGWGLHLIDIAMAQGDLVSLGERQANKWLGE